jgi:hypothetical protein
MRAFGGTCPMCCGDLDDVVLHSTGAAVCHYCGHVHVERRAAPLSRRVDASPMLTDGGGRGRLPTTAIAGPLLA